MVTKEEPELISSHRHTESIAINGTTSSGKTTTTKNWWHDSFTSGKQEGKHMEAETQFHHKSHSQPHPPPGMATYHQEKTSKPEDSPSGMKGLYSTLGTPTFKTST